MAKGNNEAGGAPAAAPVMVKLHHDSAAACSYDGRLYEADGNGDVFVPSAAIGALVGHGYSIAPDQQRAGDGA